MASNLLKVARTPIEKRGRSFECVRCFGTKKPVINAYKYVVNHIRKHHLAANQSPAHCALCDYRCDNKEELLKHVDTYPPHRRIVEVQKKQGINVNPEAFFCFSESPYVFTEKDIVAYSKEESRKIYERRRIENGRVTTEKITGLLNPETLSEQVNSILPTIEEEQEMTSFDQDVSSKTTVENEAIESQEPSTATQIDIDVRKIVTESDSSSESTESEVLEDDRMKSFIKEMNRNLELSATFINKCFEKGEKNMETMSKLIREQTKGFSEVAYELKGLNQWLRDERERIYQRDSGNNRSNRKNKRYHPY